MGKKKTVDRAKEARERAAEKRKRDHERKMARMKEPDEEEEKEKARKAEKKARKKARAAGLITGDEAAPGTMDDASASLLAGVSEEDTNNRTRTEDNSGSQATEQATTVDERQK